jgi:hypothetical protein
MTKLVIDSVKLGLTMTYTLPNGEQREVSTAEILVDAERLSKAIEKTNLLLEASEFNQLGLDYEVEQ